MANRCAAASCLARVRHCCAEEVRAGSQVRLRASALLALQLVLLVLMLPLLLLPLWLQLVLLPLLLVWLLRVLLLLRRRLEGAQERSQTDG